MKNIELTEDHKSKLLEMCKELFPEYIETYLGVNDYDPEPDGYIYFTKNKNITRIHWFEICSIKIVNELAWRNIKTDILADCEYEDFRMKLITEIFRDKCVTETFHIIDYLYEEFKKLK